MALAIRRAKDIFKSERLSEYQTDIILVAIALFNKR